MGGDEVVLAGVVDAAGESKIVQSVAVATVLAPVHGALQKIELAAPEHGVAGVPQGMVDIRLLRVHIVLVVANGLRVVRLGRSETDTRRGA